MLSSEIHHRLLLECLRTNASPMHCFVFALVGWWRLAFSRATAAARVVAAETRAVCTCSVRSRQRLEGEPSCGPGLQLVYKGADRGQRCPVMGPRKFGNWEIIILVLLYRSKLQSARICYSYARTRLNCLRVRYRCFAYTSLS